MLQDNYILTSYLFKSKTPVYLVEESNWENLETGPPSKVTTLQRASFVEETDVKT